MDSIKNLIGNNKLYCSSCKSKIHSGDRYAECKCGDIFCIGCLGLLTDEEIKEIEEENPGHSIEYKVYK